MLGVKRLNLRSCKRLDLLHVFSTLTGKCSRHGKPKRMFMTCSRYEANRHLRLCGFVPASNGFKISTVSEMMGLVGRSNSGV